MAEAPERAEPSHWLDPPDWWLHVKPLRWIAAIAVLAWVLHATGLMEALRLPQSLIPGFLRSGPHPETTEYTRVAVGVPLADRFKSYDSVETVTTILERGGFKDFQRAIHRAEDSSSYPAYRIDTITVSAYRHLDSPGTLTLLFFNDRLFQVEFVPTEVDGYARRLRSLGMNRNRNARLEKVEGDLRMASTVELAVSKVGQALRTEPYVLWQDLRLIRERDRWDERFGAIPKNFLAK